MAITNVVGTEDVVHRTDDEIPYIQGVVLRWAGATGYLAAMMDDVLNRTVYRLYNNGGDMRNSSLMAKGSEIFAPHQALKTRWYIGYRMRYEYLGNRILYDGCGVDFCDINNSASPLLGGYDNDELAYYLKGDRFSYFELCLDWETGKLRRWIDGYELTPKDVPAAILTAGDFYLRLGLHANGAQYSRWTDFYFLVDTQDTTPCKRLGGAYIRPLDVSSGVMGAGWDQSLKTKTDADGVVTPVTPQEILNTPMSTSEASRLTPHLISSVAENPSFFYLGQPTLTKYGKIEFVQVMVNAHRKDGADSTMYVTAVEKNDVDTTLVEHTERTLTMYVDGYEGRQIANLNTTLSNVPWSPEFVAKLGIKVYTRSGGS